MKLSKLIDNYLDNLEKNKGRTKKTIKNYQFYLSRFVDFFGNKKPEKINTEIIKKYKKWLDNLIDVHGESLKKNTQNYHLIALRNFLKYLKQTDSQTFSYQDIKLQPSKLNKPSVLSESEIESLLNSPLHVKKTGKNDNLINHRDKALLELLYCTGLLVSEISDLKKSDIDLNKNGFTLKSKNHAQKTVSLSQQAKYWIKQYLNLRNDSNSYLFISHDKRTGKITIDGITPRTVQRIVNKCAKIAGINKNITPHSLRHSYTLSMIKSGVNTSQIKQLLGIKNDNSKRYA
ncbi:MAG: hypothetical protein A2725_03275 [Candidatus Magasanikbacteria bacterium RIFCSPHIGHO2_01_FULL_33_34]|uniref:Tyrosine recombinase XerC n=1 Tax=Candidatus Magasanikbacteria bacterium RIFCSPHIGHO2_01_FULL_33_34 TaxID=1798671 RepID=A0A1F6LHD2_9BACT|nr:MAG: hypothetical protein A2725_03275 [Candidatus Magasanikbacteria bacterium RIFCSPHIGHO2_01_FULL_33_34]OGH66152.1 MAG: hypothetical protein A3B83_00765 [Candidatus Magasanikbacteria bacterium RIFCSPHIGHO2_02_FULL_33_17]OGH75998.1 MAG: hypothetical protein A3A89_00675 [Candidatus Magasanikbacteria bacterium RIFCSPLOWO2_01_FULL_33_34]OGH81560.1 MAG: hypothetical protein A3F93_03300 [Candidatus Magasanikbacteria bacterium RIFCSPLOWO2_12_FULL_34_7]